jgi:hypothetical protein
VGKDRSLAKSGPSKRCFTLVGSGLSEKDKTRPERTCKDKQFSLLRTFVNYGCKKLIKLDLGWFGLLPILGWQDLQGPILYNFLGMQFTNFHDMLEGLSQASLSCPV